MNTRTLKNGLIVGCVAVLGYMVLENYILLSARDSSPSANLMQGVVRAIDEGNRLVEKFPRETRDRIEKRQSLYDSECSPIYDLADAPGIIRVVYSKKERDAAGKVTAPCTTRYETAESLHAGVDYPPQKQGTR